jgi:predicted RND superfamily exporter protein
VLAGSDEAVVSPNGSGSNRRERVFRLVIARRWFILAAYVLLLPPSAYLAARVGQDNSIDRLIVASDPDYRATRAFEGVFGGGEFALLLFEADDPLAPGVVERLDRVERQLAGIPGVTANSALSVFRRARAGFEATPEQTASFREFATGTDLFRRQGLVGDRYLAIGVVLEVSGSDDRLSKLERIDSVLAGVDADSGPVQGIHRLGQPYVNAYLDETQRSAWHQFVLFVVFVILLNVSLYRSWRTLIAFLLTLGVCLALSMGYIGLTGGMLTIVSPMVPMTILVTATATLVYLHARFVECPPGRSVAEHQIFALTNKFVACTASIFATAVGFAALMVSNIRPIYEMGLWVAVGLVLTWVVVFTLFPVLQAVLSTPTQGQRRAAAMWFTRFAAWLPRATYRWRWPLVAAFVGLSGLGAAALFGVPGIMPPMRILTDPVEYMNPDAPLYKDIRRLQPLIPGLSVTQVWLRGDVGAMSEADVLTGVHTFQQALESMPDVGAAVGPTTIMRIIRYVAGEGDAWPQEPAALEEVAANLEGLVGVEPMLQRFVQRGSLAQAQLTVITRTAEHEDFERLRGEVQRAWDDSTARHPALRGLRMEVVGLTPLHAKMAQSLVPTLVESFMLTVAVIFCAFLLVFRSGAARLLAMIPSIFAILVMFLVMRATGMLLNIATILIASTVLGTSENDQIHFFYHYQEGRRRGSVEQALRHTLLVSGRAIFFATMINAGGFLAFALAELPPMSQFGKLAALAFALSMIADFTALPAALWILSRQRPDGESPAACELPARS